MDFAAMRGRAEALAAPVVDRVQSIRIDPPAVPLSRVLIGIAIGVALAVGGAWWIKRERDAWWREKIAASSASVRAAMQTGADAAVATDDAILRGLKDADDKLGAAEHALEVARRQAQQGGADRDQCRVPAHCLGVRPQ